MNHLWEDADVLLVLHGRAKVKVFDFDAYVVGTFVGVRDGAIYVDIGIEHVNGGRDGIIGVV